VEGFFCEFGAWDYFSLHWIALKFGCRFYKPDTSNKEFTENTLGRVGCL